ncbi:MAG: hypothetical protein GY802_22760, partial [Gammaproteobacteria bacterium]|nr:hypothetical protein [Gammaproteobacteria bacterium]
MNPDSRIPDASFALLTTGANFSCAVLQALIQKGYSPGLVILPEYPPAPDSADSVSNLISVTTPGRLLRLAQGIDIAYAPAARQAECFTLIKRRNIDFLLIACWPYLIDTRLIETGVKAALNLHPSLLPKYRGPDPLEQQL